MTGGARPAMIYVPLAGVHTRGGDVAASCRSRAVLLSARMSRAMIAATMRAETYASPRAWIGPVNGAPGLVQQGYLICGEKVPGNSRRAGCPTRSAHRLSVRDHGGQDVPVLVDEMPAATAGHHQAAGSLIGGEFPFPAGQACWVPLPPAGPSCTGTPRRRAPAAMACRSSPGAATAAFARLACICRVSSSSAADLVRTAGWTSHDDHLRVVCQPQVAVEVPAPSGGGGDPEQGL